MLTTAPPRPRCVGTRPRARCGRGGFGNLTSDGLRVFSYNGANRLSQTTVSDADEGSKITYLHNALGQRVFKSEPQVAQLAPNAATLGQSFVYDEAQLGSNPVLLGEYGVAAD